MPDGGAVYGGSRSILTFGRRALEIAVIEDYADFRALKRGWQALEAADPHHTVFLGWSWLDRVFRDNPGAWRVLIVRDPARGSDPVCILPLRVKTHWSARRGEFRTILGPAGRLIWSEYVGWLCHPDYDSDAIRMTGAAIKQMPWVQFEMRYEATDSRLRSFAAAFKEDAAFKVEFPEYRINQGSVDNLACPRVDLPDNFEAFRDGIASKNTRQKLRRMWKRHFRNGDWRVTFSDAETVRRDVDILVGHWLEKWTPVKGEEQARRVARNYRAILTNAFKTDCLCLAVLWEGDTPLAALGHVVDHDMDRVHFIVAGRNEDAADKPVGLLLHARSIAWAIEHGFSEYDFCHGDEAYKFHFGAEVTRVGNLRISRRSRGARGYFDPACRPEAEEQAARLLRKGRDDEAQAARLFLDATGA
ncbi:Acetyltransferase involved in cellulose biosynthesis, CelD/BcsL family [Roseivivax lentus]|uniref:Acetyltransferase involved in cellulose biosynthesis, CelD/BcsL family n=1 Tax=Roseivivax lentus TaxID=633194 RepID=A0A1N7L2G3_9RHOB|nr:GNAT family N-acetyltransferase [Roseivivax lentus]SIS68043.1 Acetyltransferase involved in cellulose biosynthesis, CelD/BcsL family [Roseivivax lentus]